MATKGQAIEKLRHSLEQVIVARSGVLAEGGACTVWAVSQLLAMDSWNSPATPNRDASMKVKNIQNADGSFPSMPGYDTPPAGS